METTTAAASEVAAPAGAPPLAVAEGAVAEGAEGEWVVRAKNGVVVRSGVELSSTEVARLANGAAVSVLERRANSEGTERCRLGPPTTGWVSAKVLRPAVPN